MCGRIIKTLSRHVRHRTLTSYATEKATEGLVSPKQGSKTRMKKTKIAGKWGTSA